MNSKIATKYGGFIEEIPFIKNLIDDQYRKTIIFYRFRFALWVLMYAGPLLIAYRRPLSLQDSTSQILYSVAFSYQILELILQLIFFFNSGSGYFRDSENILWHVQPMLWMSNTFLGRAERLGFNYFGIFDINVFYGQCMTLNMLLKLIGGMRQHQQLWTHVADSCVVKEQLWKWTGGVGVAICVDANQVLPLFSLISQHARVVNMCQPESNKLCRYTTC